MGNKASFPVVPTSQDRIVMVTGANCGIGYEIAKWTAMMGATVILACRSEEKARAAIEKMEKEFTEEKARGTSKLTERARLAIEFMKVDLGSFKSVDHFCEEYKKSGRPLHVLVCNAGIASIPFMKNEDGLEMILQVNYLSHFLITAKLLPTMKRSGVDCRIIFVSSTAEKLASFDKESINYTGSARNYPVHSCYNRSKLYQVMQMFAMSRRLTGTNITVNSLHPGIVETEIWRYSNSWMTRCLLFFARCFCVTRTPINGATCAIDLAVNPEHTGVSGHFWKDCKMTSTSRLSRNEEKQEALWNASFNFVNEYLTMEEINCMEGENRNI
ncbi:retinol dehydrogenase 14-like [Mercenaria mercenaria]|uniref:retinol dehydrogenase 14-like n=1 Tax=Mercenaria mercenaria TaxID=6596 RepID=UPI00234E8E3B|nr:retinol dehydrogenase 14-like [Mercenaria mercenaria]